MTKHRLDSEEKELLRSVEQGEWESTQPTKAGFARYVRAARNTLRKDKRVNIRISQSDLEGLQSKAIQDGIPYQTFIASVLHRYLVGRLIPRS